MTRVLCLLFVLATQMPQPEAARGTYPLPSVIGMTSPPTWSGREAVYTARASLKNANEGVVEDEKVAYVDVLVKGVAHDPERQFGVVLAGDRDHPMVRWLESARERGVVIRIVLEEIDP